MGKDELKAALAAESKAFEAAYLWFEKQMPEEVLHAIDPSMRMLIARNLLSFSVQGKFSPIYFKHKIIVLCEDADDADLQILKKFKSYPIRYYRTFVSKTPLPGEEGKLRIAIMYFHDLSKTEKIGSNEKKELFALAKKHNAKLKSDEIETLIQGLTPNFLRSMKGENLELAVDMFFRAKSREQCQYEVEKKGRQMKIVMAWRNVPKSGFLYHLAQLIWHHGLGLQKVVGTYIDVSAVENVLILSLSLTGFDGNEDFLRELALIKYFETDDRIGQVFADTKLLTGNEAHFVRNMASFVHQTLVYADPNLYSLNNVEEGLCRHPELTVALCKAFGAKFDPEKADLKTYEKLKKGFEEQLSLLDTGQVVNDARRKNILRQGMNFIDCLLKTNFYRHNKCAFSFRLDPKYMDNVPFERKEKFPELPFAIFFVRGMHFIAFNIRFKDLARGGVRTVIPERFEQYLQERNTIFSEAYNLAYTQHKKNKDIPEGGAKTAILLEPLEVLLEEEEALRKEMQADDISKAIQDEKIKHYRKDHRLGYLFEAQRAFIDSFMTLLNCEENGKLKAKDIVDYWKKPEYIYLGPDENMFNEMIVWIANFAEEHCYTPGRSFISSKPGAGINHKEFGVTSHGVNVYLHETLLFLGIDPEKDPFTVKISGGPDGDVAGNEILNLYKYYPKTAKIVALTDGSGTIFDADGLDLKEMETLFKKGLPINSYPTEKLQSQAFLLDLKASLLKTKGKEKKLSNNETNHLFRTSLHQVKADVFIPAGGRPRTLNEANYTSFLDEQGKPTSKAIVEGANLYLTPGARHALEKLGVLIMKDSSCNKGGVMCSSFEVLASLCMSVEEFIKAKPRFVKEVLEIIAKACRNEAKLLLDSHKKTGKYLSDLSDLVSERINLFKYQILDHLELLPLKDKMLIECLFRYSPPILRKEYKAELLKIPEIHKKAIIACYIASHLVYKLGLDWNPTISDILPIIFNELNINDLE